MATVSTGVTTNSNSNDNNLFSTFFNFYKLPNFGFFDFYGWMEKLRNIGNTSGSEYINKYELRCTPYTKTIYTWLSNQIRPEISIIEYNRLKKENEELKRIVGIITLELERGKKIEIVNSSSNKKLISECMNINRKNIYNKSKKDVKIYL